jgi:hypothetical protein
MGRGIFRGPDVLRVVMYRSECRLLALLLLITCSRRKML